jgi:hypothetical protein
MLPNLFGRRGSGGRLNTWLAAATTGLNYVS